jgi:hypothetical protein
MQPNVAQLTGKGIGGTFRAGAFRGCHEVPCSSRGLMMYIVVITRLDMYRAVRVPVGAVGAVVVIGASALWFCGVLRAWRRTAVCTAAASHCMATLQWRQLMHADWASDRDNRRSTTGYVFLLNGGALSWKSHLQLADYGGVDG